MAFTLNIPALHVHASLSLILFLAAISVLIYFGVRRYQRGSANVHTTVAEVSVRAVNPDALDAERVRSTITLTSGQVIPVALRDVEAAIAAMPTQSGTEAANEAAYAQGLGYYLGLPAGTPVVYNKHFVVDAASLALFQNENAPPFSAAKSDKAQGITMIAFGSAIIAMCISGAATYSNSFLK